MAAIALAASGELGHDWTTIHPISFLNIHTHIYIYLYKIKSSSRHQGNIYLFFIVPLGSRPRDDRFSRDAYGKNRVLIHLNSDHIFFDSSFSVFFFSLSFFFDAGLLLPFPALVSVSLSVCLLLCIRLTCYFFFSLGLFEARRNARDGSLYATSFSP